MGLNGEGTLNARASEIRTRPTSREPHDPFCHANCRPPSQFEIADELVMEVFSLARSLVLILIILLIVFLL